MSRKDERSDGQSFEIVRQRPNYYTFLISHHRSVFLPSYFIGIINATRGRQQQARYTHYSAEQLESVDWELIQHCSPQFTSSALARFHIHYSDEQLHKMDWELLHLCSTSFTSSALALFHFWSLHAYAANCQTTSPFPTYSLAHPEPTSTKNIKTASPKCTSIDWILILFFSLRSKWMPGDLESIDTDSGG